MAVRHKRHGETAPMARGALAIAAAAALCAAPIVPQHALAGTVSVEGGTGPWHAYELVAGDVSDGQISNCSTDGLMNARFWEDAGISGTGDAAASSLAALASEGDGLSPTARLGRAAERSGATYRTISPEEAQQGVELPNGYWLLTSAADQPMLLLVGDRGTQAHAKSTGPAVDKEVRGSGGTYGKVAEAGRGDVLEYRVTASMPSNAASYEKLSYKVVDELPDGLSVAKRDVFVTVTRADGSKQDVTASCTVSLSDGRLAVDVGGGDALPLLGGSPGEATVTVSYSATATSSVKTGTSKGNPNTAWAEYTRSPTSDGTGSTQKSTCQALSWRIALEKTGDGSALSGAAFELRDAHGDVVGRGTTGNGGRLTFPQVKSGTYRLVETRAPRGYAAAEDTEVTVSASPAADLSSSTLSARATGGGKVVSSNAASGIVRVAVDDPASGTAAGGGTAPSGTPGGSRGNAGTTSARPGNGSSGGWYSKTGASIAGLAALAAALAAAGAAIARRARKRAGARNGVEQGD